IALWRDSEVELCADLDLACSGGAVVLADLRRGVAKIGIADGIVRLVELSSVEHIVELKAQLEIQPLGDGGGFREIEIPLVDARAVPVLASDVGRHVERNRHDGGVIRVEGQGIFSGENGAAGDERAHGRNRFQDGGVHDGGAVGEIGVWGVGGAKDVIRQAGLKGGDAAEFPTCQRTPDETFIEASLAAADVGLVNEIDDAAMAGVKTGVAFLAAQIEGIDREIAIAEGIREWVGGIVQSVGIGVRALDLQAVEVAFGDLNLQAVVPGMAAAFVEESVNEGVVVDGVKRQHAEFLAQEKIAELQSGFAAAEGVGGISAERLELRDQGWLRGRAIHNSENSSAVIAHVVGLDNQV